MRVKKRSFWRALVFEKDNDLNLSWIITVIIMLAGVFAIICDCVTGHSISNAAWAWLGGSFASVLIASVPIAKAKILANATLPGSTTDAIGKALVVEHEWKDGDPHKGVI